MAAEIERAQGFKVYRSLSEVVGLRELAEGLRYLSRPTFIAMRAVLQLPEVERGCYLGLKFGIIELPNQDCFLASHGISFDI